MMTKAPGEDAEVRSSVGVDADGVPPWRRGRRQLFLTLSNTSKKNGTSALQGSVSGSLSSYFLVPARINRVLNILPTTAADGTDEKDANVVLDCDELGIVDP